MNNSDDAVAGEDRRASASEAWLGRQKQARGIQSKTMGMSAA